MAKWTVVTLAAVSFNAWAQDFSTSGGSVSSGSTTFSHEVRISGLSADFSFVNIEPDKGSSQDITMTKASTIGPDIAFKFSLGDLFVLRPRFAFHDESLEKLQFSRSFELINDISARNDGVGQLGFGYKFNNYIEAGLLFQLSNFSIKNDDNGDEQRLSTSRTGPYAVFSGAIQHPIYFEGEGQWTWNTGAVKGIKNLDTTKETIKHSGSGWSLSFKGNVFYHPIERVGIGAGVGFEYATFKFTDDDKMGMKRLSLNLLQTRVLF